MDDSALRRFCDGLSGAGAVTAFAGLAVGEWLGALVCLAVAIGAQVIRATIDS